MDPRIDTPAGGDAPEESELMQRLVNKSRVEAGMPDRQLDDRQLQSLRDRINEWINTHGISQARLAAYAEFSKGTLSQILSNTYRADPTKRLLILDAIMQDPKALRELTGPETFAPVHTSTVTDMQAVVEGARRRGTCVLIWGPSGAGKTTYAKTRALEKDTCIYVELESGEYTRSRLLRAIAEAMGIIGSISEGRTSGDYLLTKICNALKDNNRVVFIDNAHLLDKHGLWVLCCIHDRTAATFVCIGQPKLYEAVTTSRKDKGIGATVYSRFGAMLDLTSQTRIRSDPTDPTKKFKPARAWLHTPEDVAKFLRSRKLKFHPGIIDYLVRLVNRPDGGGLHALDDIVGWAIDLFPDVDQITMREIVQISNFVLPQEEQAVQHSEMEHLRPSITAAG